MKEPLVKWLKNQKYAVSPTQIVNRVSEDKMSKYAKIINDRKLFGGQDNGLMAISPMKHDWARSCFKKMTENFWTKKVVDLTTDRLQYHTLLTDAERNMYDKALAFLSNLDGIQLNNLTRNISHHITSPEVSMCVSMQIAQEAIHVDAYSSMIEAISPDCMEVYMTYETDQVLADKNRFILQSGEIMGEAPTPENFVLAIVANIALEGVYFYTGFLAFYVLAKNGKMGGSADMIRYIQRDEVEHLNLFVNMFYTMKTEYPEIFTNELYEKMKTILLSAGEHEKVWGRHIISGGVLGLSVKIVDDYVDTLINSRAGMIGIPELVSGATNPVKWVESFSAINNNEVNLFEATQTAYTVGGTLDWGD